VDAIEDNLGYFFHAIAASSPEKTALIDLWGGQERISSYRELDQRTDRAAALLLSLGLSAGDRLALLVGNRGEYIEIFFGAMRAGIVPVPLNIKQTTDNLKFMFTDAGCVGAVVDGRSVMNGIAIVDACGLKVKIALEDAPSGWVDYGAAKGVPAGFTPAISTDGIAFQPYTAGSTGRPKGVRLTHQGMLWSIRSTQELWPMAPSEIGLVAVPLFHKNAMRGTIKPAFYAGASVVLMPRFDARAFLEAAASYKATFAGGVPAIFSMLLEQDELLSSLDLSSLNLFAIGSAVVPGELIGALERAFPSVKVKESYGLTEAGGPLRDPIPKRPVPRGSCGVPTPGYEVELVGIDGSEGVPEGELRTRNPCVTAGYHNLPEETREKIVDGWLRTGDIFRVDENGFYYFMGRVDDMFSCGGENIYPKEVENLLLAHPAVREACVVPVPHHAKGFVPAAAVILHGRKSTTADELKRFCLERGPAFSHPRRVIIVDELPLSGAGKPDRKAIQQQLIAGGQ
jgi:long-chain acyl-CoA synthetase